MAIRLDKASGGGADTWYRLQAAYDLARAIRKADHIKIDRLTPVAQEHRRSETSSRTAAPPGLLPVKSPRPIALASVTGPDGGLPAPLLAS